MNKILSIACYNINRECYNKNKYDLPNGKFKVGEKNKITFLLHSFKELPKYDVYKVEDEKDVKISSENFSKFDYEYLPKSNSDNKVSLKIRIPNSEVEILNETTIPLK